ncbi:cold-shock protein [Pseudomonas tolaasii]|uniref:Cold-shock protein n=2 Tax=Pseudomonas tolaasii TaxID=29442 RepID=A0A7Y8ANG5_PSETO|nr:cold shock domain-containing protein [Pseudomonas tolaasii]ARB30685.1 DNA-binding protein [Pseudomonas tolaasii]KAB0477932.1 cold-shock protein [Pseudomonas tolaasii]MBW1248037.1 cold-shock protein [Pseudomonas tolaasii]MBY8940394.1 cold-shock protein [Pseudomonas tolaasii]NWC20498.1 cold-shock protein [Pseudomonas tolaasii]
MEAITGTIKSYNRSTGEGFILLDDAGESVRVDLKSSAGVWLQQGQRVQFGRIHRPKGVFALYIKVI